MTNQELAKRQERAASEALVIAELDTGFRVYAAAEPKRAYLVTGMPKAPGCSCPDFARHAGDPEWRCKHVLAVQERFFGGNGKPEADPYDVAERQAIQEESKPTRRRKTSTPAPVPANGSAQMLLKRSMSPDGRIDSLSVEFSLPIGLEADDVKARAKEVLSLQSAILADFMGEAARPGNGKRNGITQHLSLNGNGKGNGAPPSGGTQGNGSAAPTPTPSDGSEPAVMLAIGGMDGKWSRRLFLVFDVGGRQTRLFGNKKQLGEAITGAGYVGLAANVAEGVSLNVPCRVVTKPSPDGRFLDITKVLPPGDVP